MVDNKALNETVQMYESPNVVHSTIEIAGNGEKVHQAFLIRILNFDRAQS